MPEFSYIARTQDGVRKEDTISAINIKEASDILASENLSVIKISERDASFDFMGPFMERFNLSIDRLKNRIPLTSLVFFTRQLATMFSAGLTIERSLHFLKGSFGKRNYQFFVVSQVVLLNLIDYQKKHVNQSSEQKNLYLPMSIGCL